MSTDRPACWFETLTGFTEVSSAHTREHLAVDGPHLVSKRDGRRWRIGELEWPSLAELRARVDALPLPGRASTVAELHGDARRLHHDPALAGTLFQVASQFNLLEMVGPHVSPEDGVAGYAFDPTQGPACAIAAGAATIYRNHFVPLGDGFGQDRHRQLDMLADVGALLAARLDRPVTSLWSMRNGYALPTADGLEAIAAHLETADPAERDALRQRLRIGLHWGVEVTDAPGPVRPVVSQAFCSALPVAYTRLPQAAWAPFARLVLEATYEATLLAAALHPGRGGAPRVVLTRVGGGAFGNAGEWIDAAIERALSLADPLGLDVRINVFSRRR